MINKPDGFILRGDLCFSLNPQTLRCVENGYLVCTDGLSQGVFEALPERFENLPLFDYGGKLIVPGLTDLHTHAPQYAFRGLGMDLELLDWLKTYTFREEAKYADLEYAKRAYAAVVRDMLKGPNTRVCLFATVHLPATELLMDMLEESGLVCLVGKVNMDRNSPADIREENAARAAADTRRWLEYCAGRYRNAAPILTPRFVPTCSDTLLWELSALQKEFRVPVQSHLSENRGEIKWVSQLSPSSGFYGEVYEQCGLLGGDVPTIMAHCVWSGPDEIELLRRKGVYAAHCPQSNENLSSGIAPVRRLLDNGVKTGLGSDVAGGCHTSIFRAMADAISVSKLRFVYEGDAPLTVNEAFYMGTLGGGSFFGKAGSFEAGYELDALVIDDSSLAAPFPLTIEERLARVIHLSDDRHIFKKYVRGCSVL